VANDTRPPSNPGLGYVSKVSPDQMVERAMIQGIKYVDAFPSTVEGGYSPMNKSKDTRCQVGSSINLAEGELCLLEGRERHRYRDVRTAC
jgi:hypothetical protein